MKTIEQTVNGLLDYLSNDSEELYKFKGGWERWDLGVISEDDFEEVEPQVMIGDVLDRLRFTRAFGYLDNEPRILDAWRCFGHKKPLNDILSGEMDFENDILNRIGLLSNSGENKKFKDPNTQALYELLMELFGDKITVNQK